MVVFELFWPVEFRPLEEEGKELLDRSHRADPSACHTAQDERHQDSKDSGEEKDRNHPRGNKGHECEKRVEMEKYFHPFDIILSRKAGHEEKIEKKAKKDDLCEDPQDLNDPVFFR